MALAYHWLKNKLLERSQMLARVVRCSMSNANHETVFFVHIPKTAGTSLRNALVRSRKVVDSDPWNISDRREHPDIVWQSIRSLNKNRIPTVGLAMAHAPIGFGKYFRNPKFITVIRDPVERILSSYFHMLRDRNRLTGDLKQDVSQLAAFAENPAFANLQMQYFMDFDVQNATCFVTSDRGADVKDNSYIGIRFATNDSREIRRIRMTQRRGGVRKLEVQVSNDDFNRDIKVVPSRIVFSGEQRVAEIQLMIPVKATGWRIKPLEAPATDRWYVNALEFWTMKDGAFELAAGGLFEESTFGENTFTKLIPYLPNGASAIGANAVQDCGPELAFDGRNAITLHDIDGTMLTTTDLEIAKKNVERCSAIGLVDDMDAFIELLRKRFNFQELEIGRDNAGTSANQYDEIDKGLIAHIRSINQLDCDFYEHARELSRSQMIRAGIAFNEAAYAAQIA